MLENLYENIGIKIKEWAQGIFIAETVIAVIAGIALFINKYFLAGILTFVLGPYIAWVSSWLLYAFGQLVDDIHAMRNQASAAITKKQVDSNTSYPQRKSEAVQPKQDWLTKSSKQSASSVKRCPHCGEIAKSNTCEMCGKEINL